MADSESMVIQYLAYTENNRSLSEYVIRSDWLELLLPTLDRVCPSEHSHFMMNCTHLFFEIIFQQRSKEECYQGSSLVLFQVNPALGDGDTLVPKNAMSRLAEAFLDFARRVLGL